MTVGWVFFGAYVLAVVLTVAGLNFDLRRWCDYRPDDPDNLF